MPTSPLFSITEDPTYTGASNTLGTPGDIKQYTLLVTNGVAAEPSQALSYLTSQWKTGQIHPDPVWGGVVVVKQQIVSVKAPSSCFIGQVTFGVLLINPPQDVTDFPSLLNTPAKVESISPEFFQEIDEFDIFGDPICNSAGDMFDPPGMVDKVRVLLVVSRFKTSYVGSTYLPFFGILNDQAYKMPGLGLCAIRTVRCLAIRPASGFNATANVPISGLTGTFNPGDTLTWPTGGTGSVVATLNSNTILQVLNPSISFASGVTITSSSGGTCTVSTTTVIPPVKVLWIFEYRPDGFDRPITDKGTRGWWTDGSNISLGHFFTIKDHVEVS